MEKRASGQGVAVTGGKPVQKTIRNVEIASLKQRAEHAAWQRVVPAFWQSGPERTSAAHKIAQRSTCTCGLSTSVPKRDRQALSAPTIFPRTPPPKYTKPEANPLRGQLSGYISHFVSGAVLCPDWIQGSRDHIPGFFGKSDSDPQMGDEVERLRKQAETEPGIFSWTV